MTTPATQAAAFSAVDHAGEGRNEPNTADRLLNALHQHGIDYFFANAGTDFASIMVFPAPSRPAPWCRADGGAARKRRRR